ncbi:MAG: TonB C-terminal domain-containing protein [Mariprofundales bacterium]
MVKQLMQADLWYRMCHEQSWRWFFSLLASVLVHVLLLILLLSLLFSAKTPTPNKQMPILDVVLLKQLLEQQKIPPPKIVDAVANINATGGNSSDNRITRTTIPIPLPTQTTRAKQKEHQKQKYVQKRIMKTVPTSSNKIPKQTIDSTTKPTTKPITPTLPDLNFSLADANRIEQQKQRSQQRASNNKREAEISVNTRRAKYVPYVHELVRKLEEQWRPADNNYNNYREKDRQVYMRITIESDGSLGGIDMLRPSLLSGLNASALRAVRDAAPFRTLPSSWGLDRVHFRLVFEVVEDRFIFR